MFLIIMMLELHTEQVLDQQLNFLRFCVNKTPQTSRTFQRILVEYKIVVFYNSTILVSISISLNCCFNFFGVIPNAPTTTGITFNGIFSSIIFSTFHFIFLPIFNSAIKRTCKVNNFALTFGLIYYYHIRSSCLNDMISLYHNNIPQYLP